MPGEQLHWPERSVRQQLERYRGVLRVKSQNLYFATFDGPSRTLQCAQVLNRLAQQSDLSVRIALHTGECLIAENELRGPAVEIAKAVMQTAEEGEVWLSHTVKDLVVGAGFSFVAQGTLQLKGELGTW